MSSERYIKIFNFSDACFREWDYTADPEFQGDMWFQNVSNMVNSQRGGTFKKTNLCQLHCQNLKSRHAHGNSALQSIPTESKFSILTWLHHIMLNFMTCTPCLELCLFFFLNISCSFWNIKTWIRKLPLIVASILCMSVCMECEIKTNTDFNTEDYVYIIEYL
jgi:hypothetical protein